MKKVNSVKKNYIYSVLLQTITIMLPIITTPYVSRVLGADGVGKYSYTGAIVTMMINFGSLGMAAYASRQVAYFRDDEYEVERFCNEIFSIKVLQLFPVLFIYLLLIWKLTDYRVLCFIQAFEILATVFNVEWYYTGVERFDATVIRSILIKLCSVFLIFGFVKTHDDLFIFVIIQTLAIVGGHLALFLPIRKKLRLVCLKNEVVKAHLWGALKLFFPQLAGSVYLYCDKIMLGWLSTSIVENGYYEQSLKIIRLSTTLITSLPTVMLPRISNSISSRKDEVDSYMEKSILFVICLGIPMVFGVIAISNTLVPWFLGAEYMKSALLLKILAPIIFINGIYNVLGYQYLLASKQEKVMTITIAIGAITNIALNLFLIPKMGATGASISSVAAELVVAIAQVYYLRSMLRKYSLRSDGAKSMFCSIIMFVVLILVSNHLNSSLINTLTLILLGGVIYVLLAFLLKVNFVIGMFGDFCKMIFNR